MTLLTMTFFTLLCTGFSSQAWSDVRSDYVLHLAEKTKGLPTNTDINTEADWEKSLGAAPPWTGYPQAEGLKTVEALKGIHDYEIQKEFIPQDGDSLVHLAQGVSGFSPRNLMNNRKLSPRSEYREAMPLHLAHPSLSLTDSEGKLRETVLEWTNTRYRNELTHLLTEPEAREWIIAQGITYQNIWFDRPLDPFNYALKFDDQGRPLSPNPRVEMNGIAGHGFYFRLGQNIAVDVLLTFENAGGIYAVFNKRSDANDIAFPAGMVDIEDSTRIAAAFRELGEETGIQLDLARIESENKSRLVWTGTVGGELRATRNAWTDSNLYHIHFESLVDFSRYLVSLDSSFDRDEISKRYIFQLGYIVEHYLMPEGSLSGRMFASHGKMLAFALGKFFSAHPDKAALLVQTTDTSFEAARMSFGELRAQLLEIKASKAD